MTYVSLHAHTIFSMLDGHATVKDYVAKVKSLGHTHAAITDHGTMAGIPDFITECKKNDLIPIIGFEAYVEPDDATRRDSDHAGTHHLTLLAQNHQGYRNLIKLATFASSVGFYRKPRVDWGMLERHNEGLIALSGCTSSELSHAILDQHKGVQTDVDRIVDFYQSVFKDRYFLEEQDHGDYEEQQIVNTALREIAPRFGLQSVATNDSHYCNAEDYEAQRLLLSIKMGPDLKLGSPYTFVRSNEEMAHVFSPDLLRTSLDIADRIESYEIGSREPKLPVSPLERIGESPTEVLQHLVVLGLSRRLEGTTGSIPLSTYVERQDSELEVVKKLSQELGADFSRYILMIADIANYCREHRIRFGPRGSAAGSLICWALGISEPDPIKDGLYFERFLNPFRVELPDVDLDFADDRREDVFRYIRDTYGEENVAKIGTYSMIGTKQAIKDAAKHLRNQLEDFRGGYLGVAHELISLIPDDPRPGGIPLHEVMADPEGKGKAVNEYANKDERTKQVLQDALKIEGRARGDGMHAAGVVVCNQPIGDILPLMWTKEARDRKKEAVIPFQTQYEMMHLEKLGLLKVDILGLKTLSVLDLCLKLIEQKGVSIDPWKIDWTDAKAWDLIQSGKTLSLFQIGADGLAHACHVLQPNNIEDLALTVAVYRPGPMQNFKEIVDRKNNGAAIGSLDPTLDGILARTYGFPVYQEQVMEVARTFAGYSLGEADLLRKAMGKKIREKMAEEKDKFIAGSDRLGHLLEDAERVWSFLLPFADYGFNRAHAICYAYVAYQTAWLKANYPQEFYTAALTIESTTGSADETPQQRIGRIIREARSVVHVLPPDVQNPAVTFQMEGDAIRHSLSSVKDVGLKDAIQIVEQRKKGEFKGIGDFIYRCSSVRRSSLEALALVGALPWLNRRTLTEEITLHGPRGGKTETTVIGSIVLKRAESKKKGSVFEEPEIDLLPEYNQARLLLEEQSRLGTFKTALPDVEIPYYSIDDVRHGEFDGKTVTMMGVITAFKEKVTKKTNQAMGYATLLDESGADFDLVIFPKNYELITNKDVLQEGKLVHVSGKIKVDFATKMFLEHIWEVYIPERETAQKALDAYTIIVPELDVRTLTRIYQDYQEGAIPLSIEYGSHKETLFVSSLTISKLRDLL